ncbi:lysis system i-spanin subunit Rz [Caballeronia sp. ATUFL_F1_KS4A]|uniref:lysis system i-spanin subunit Rz n=1 Tax=Caballeronia sp. ATUFL_F1_KS4A TaxID=2921768 RepID=UPI0020286429|nr:lysis system i-spanin subunit Rz [Caballeronia sp. ATUFL_F1_KS4A]
MSYAPHLVACAIGMALGGATMHVFDGTELGKEQVAHARDNEANTQKLTSLSEGAAKAASDAVAAHNAAAARIAALDDRYHHERKIHEADTAKNRAAIAGGTRRLRVAIADATSRDHSGPANQGATAGGMGDGPRRYAELSPEVGRALFEIVDNADGDARAKADYLQQYVIMLQKQGIVARSKDLGEGPQ